MSFSFKFRSKDHIGIQFAKGLYPLLGVVLIWRGVWYVLDEIDLFVFGRNHGWTSAIGIIVGLVLLYLPERNLRDIHKL